jgi:DNA polymerase III subunit delta'
MAFTSFPKQTQGVQLLQRSIERQRLGHGYLFTGHQLDQLEALARTLAKTLNCRNPVRASGAPIDSCDVCPSCTKIDHATHADIHWIRPESKTRIITIEQVRDLLHEIQLKPTEARYKVAVVVAADRLRTEAANAFLKTLEEPPANSLLILLTTEPQRLLETILSRCLRLNFAGEDQVSLDPSRQTWLNDFIELAASEQKSLIGRYRLMDVLLQQLNQLKGSLETTLRARSPLEQYEEVEKELRDRWEDELSAAIEAEYRRQRSELLALLHWWLRDVWLLTLRNDPRGSANRSAATIPLSYPQLPGTQQVACRISTWAALENLDIMEQLQRRLHTNVQEALAIEVGLLKLRL